MIPSELARCFSRGARERGERYFVERKLGLLSAEPLFVELMAAGTSDWIVRLDARENGALRISCNCPFAWDYGFCKHEWAALRLADQERLLKPLVDAAVGNFVEASDNGDFRIARSAPETDAAIGQHPRTRDPFNHDAGGTGSSGWRRVIDLVRQQARYEAMSPPSADWPNDRRLIYLADLTATVHAAGLVIELATEKRGRDGVWGVPKLFRSGLDSWQAIPDPIDREIGQMLRGVRHTTDWTPNDSMAGFVVPPQAFEPLLRLMSETGRLRIRRDSHERPIAPAHLDPGDPWQIRFRIDGGGERKPLRLVGELERGEERMPLAGPDLIHHAGFLIADQTIARVDMSAPFALVAELRTNGPIQVDKRELSALIGALAELPRAPRIELPAGIEIREVAPAPVPVLTITRNQGWREQLTAALAFDYDGMLVSESRPGRVIFDARGNRVVHRDGTAEEAARALLASVGVQRLRDWRMSSSTLTLPPFSFEHVLNALTVAGWRVSVDGRMHRSATDVRANVRSGIDWFDLDIAIAFGDLDVPVKRILEALRNKEKTIDLDEGAVGVISEEVKRRLAPLLSLANAQGFRFRRSQTALLDALIATLPAVDVDERFANARAELQTFERIEPITEPQTFHGQLRPYQREGLGWFHFLQRFGLGGCLADDMGLGKTVQVLALLEQRRLQSGGPSLIVVPRSLVFNWQQEAARFTPELCVLDHSGVGRQHDAASLHKAHLVLTTYGTLRSDITVLREIEFDYAVLDEAQAIKNATTATAKAARLLRARHRLALTGTPIENRVDELWSLFEFLNPGMLGSATSFKALARARTLPNDRDETALLARALRPVILRRTKERVSPELPPRSEQTLMVELEPAQRRIYDGLLAHYRESLLPYVERVGMARSKMKVLEALLRLRQAACHPTLVMRDRTDAHSAKLDVLLPKLAEAREEGHKSLVFSQFTSFLALLRKQLDAENVPYAYLDGETRNRQEVVERFQTSSDCGLFLISLRAGGHGLNLTAADYVFLLDPWWNPAVEAQAIDRAHRIGQERHVIATRLVARDTIEEKILELQRSKRDLADAILSEDQGVLAKIGREELELLLA